MTGFIEQTENALRELAYDYAPPGTTEDAVVHQWLHAIASNSDLFAEVRGVIQPLCAEAHRMCITTRSRSFTLS